MCQLCQTKGKILRVDLEILRLWITRVTNGEVQDELTAGAAPQQEERTCLFLWNPSQMLVCTHLIWTFLGIYFFLMSVTVIQVF